MNSLQGDDVLGRLFVLDEMVESDRMRPLIAKTFSMALTEKTKVRTIIAAVCQFAG